MTPPEAVIEGVIVWLGTWAGLALAAWLLDLARNALGAPPKMPEGD